MSNLNNIAFCTPIYEGKAELNFFAAMTGVMQRLNEKGNGVGFFNTVKESYIPRARCTLQAQVLADPNWTHLFWVDADIEFNPDSAERLIAHDVDVVAGAYPMKALPIEYSVYISDDAEAKITVAGDTLFPMDYVSTGFLCIKRRALEMVCAAHPELKVFFPKNVNVVVPEGAPSGYIKNIATNYFATWDGMIVEHPLYEDEQMWLSEDWGWCQRYRDLGGKIWLDPEIALNHIGKFTYLGNPEVIKAKAQKHLKENTNG